MSTVRDYTLELCWLLLLVLLLTLTPARAATAEGRNFEDEAADCSDDGGWCMEMEM